MVFTAAQTTAFFENPGQMAIPAATRAQLQTEGIISVDDLSEFDNDNLKQISENLRRPSGRIPVDPNNPNGPTMPTPPFVFGAKSFNRIKASADIIRYYETVDRVITAGNMQWDPVIKAFVEHWKALKERKSKDKPETPKISRTLPVVKWTEAFHDYLHRVVGTRTIPLAYVVRSEVNVPAPTALLNGQPYSELHGSVEGELIARASHAHALYRDDNAAVYYLLEEATRGTSYAASIKPFQRTKDGRGAFLALVAQYAGEDKWRAMIKSSEELMHNRKWKGQSSYSLEKFVGQHRNAYVTLSQCQTHVQYQLPNENTRVTHLLDNIECHDPPLQAAMALVRNDTDVDGKMNDFEATASFILPHDPVAKKRSTASSKRPAADISEADGWWSTGDASEAEPSEEVDISEADVAAHSAKPRIGKTGVELRFHKHAEYADLSEEQKAELEDHRDRQEAEGKGRHLSKRKARFSNGGRQNPKDVRKTKKFKSMVAAAVAEAIKTKKDKDEGDATADQQLKDYIVSVVQSAAKGKTTNITPPTPAVTINSILGRLKK